MAGFTCDISRYPDDNLTVVLLTNLDAAHSDPRYMANVIAGLADPPLLPAKLAAISDTRPDIAALLTKLLNQFAAGEDVRPLLSPAFTRTITSAEANQARETLSKLWPGGDLTLVKRLMPPGTASPVISVFRLARADKAVMIVMALDSAGKISSFRLLPNRQYE